MSQITISIKRKNNYGTDHIYVCEPQHAEIIGRLTGKRTVSEKDLDCLKALGIEIRDIDAEIKQLINA